MPIMPSGAFRMREDIVADITVTRNIYGRVLEMARARGLTEKVREAEEELARVAELEKVL